MKNLILAVILVFFASSALAKTSVPSNTAPAGIDLENFRIFEHGELDRLGVSYTESALGLRKEVLRKPMVVQNHFRQDNSWRLQILPVGDEVFVEKSTGIARYRAACSNRIDPVLPCPTCGVEKKSSGNGSGSTTGRSGGAVLGAERFSNAFSKNFDDSLEVLGGFLGWILPWVILGLACFGLWSLLRRQQPAPAALPVTQPAPVAPQNPAVQPGFGGPPPAAVSK